MHVIHIVLMRPELPGVAVRLPGVGVCCEAMWRLYMTESMLRAMGPKMAPCNGLEKVAMPPKMPRPVR